jgi:hypothetical protein
MYDAACPGESGFAQLGQRGTAPLAKRPPHRQGARPRSEIAPFGEITAKPQRSQ